MSTGIAHHGTRAAQLVSQRIGGKVADETALVAIPADYRADGQLWVTMDGPKIWTFNSTSTATASATVLAPGAGSGRFLQTGSASGGGSVCAVRLVTAAALPAYTRTVNVILANAVGAMAVVDGVAPAVGDYILLKDGAAGADNGIYVVDDLGSGATQFQLTRAPEFDDSDDFTPNPFIVLVSEGTANADTQFVLSTNAAITLNTTALAFILVPNLADLASVATGEGASLIGIENAAGNFTAATDVEAALDETFTLLASTANTEGASLVGVEDPTGLIAGTDVEAALVEIATEIDSIGVGTPMVNRFTMLGAPGAIVGGNTVVIGADTYEFNTNTPPDIAGGGTGGFIWVYQGINSAESRANFINAVNGVVDAPTITRGDGIGPNAGTNTEFVLAAAGTTLGDVDLHSAAAIGGAIASSGVATACTETLATGTDIWDDATMQAGSAAGSGPVARASVTLTAEHITKGELEITFTFAPTCVVLSNRMRQQDEAYAVAGNVLTLTLAGGGAPNNQAADVIDVIAFG